MSTASESKVAYAQCSYWEDYEPTMENVKAAKGAVDYIIIVHEGSFSETQMQAFRDEGVSLFYHKWNDNFPEYRNASLDAARSLGATWILISDADEHFDSELFRDLKPKIIPELEREDYNMGQIRCFDAFDAIEWWDDLDQLKELPGGDARQSAWFKNLLFRLYPDLNYSGVGKEGNVHEVWGAKSEVWKPKQLPAPFHYTHRKSSLRIWVNACRNLVMGGGGDSVGDMNPMWVELRKIMKDDLGMDDWKSFDAFIRRTDKPIPPSLVDWVKRGLVFGASDYATEVRETGKMIVWYRRDLLKLPEIEYGVHHPPQRTEAEEVEMQVRKMYFQVLNRHPDRKGLDFYVQKVLSKQNTLQDVQKFLMESEEYAKTHGQKVKMEVHGNVDVTVTEDMLVNILMRTTIWEETLKPQLDIGRWVLSQVPQEERPEFIKKFYETKSLSLPAGDGQTTTTTESILTTVTSGKLPDVKVLAA